MLSCGWSAGAVVTAAVAGRIGGRGRSLLQSVNSGRNNLGSSKPKTMTTLEYREKVVCRDKDVGEGECHEFEIEEGLKCLLIRQKGQLSALSNKCTHYGAPLIKGSLGDGVIRCPWHGACFNVTTGDIEDFPGLDSLQKYDVKVDADGAVTVRAPKGQSKRTKPCAAPEDMSKCVVIVGGGPAGLECAETLRTRDKNPWKGRIVMLTQEPSAPYDRPKLSKALTSTAADLQLRQPDFFQKSNIEVVTSVEVDQVDVEQDVVRTKDGQSFAYNYLVLATGGRPRTLDNVPGSDLPNIFYLRTPDDSNRIARASKDKDVVIIGSSFIGMEVASSLITGGGAKSVTVIGGNSDVPFQGLLGHRVGSYLKGLHESKGVKFLMNTTPTEFRGHHSLETVRLANGLELSADVCVVGVGVVPCTEFLSASGLEMDGKGHVKVNNMMQTNVKNVYAAGDIALFPLGLPESSEPQMTSIGHWQLAHAHGRAAGLNIDLGIQEIGSPIKTVPFFWTVQFGKSLRYSGHIAQGFDEIVYDGVVEEGSFAAFYLKDDIVTAVAALMKDPVASDFANLLREGKKLTKSDLHNSDWRNKYSLQAMKSR